jgi:predicted Abi (CAAX) family protease
MRMFVPEVQRTLEVLAVVALTVAIALPLSWGYEQRQQARTWQETACAYRLREVTRGMTVPAAAERRGTACAVLHQLGFEVEPVP